MGRNVSTLIQSKIVATIAPSSLPLKCKDLNIFTIGDYTFTDAMLDLGALINVMPTSFYGSIHLGDLKCIGVVIQLAKRKCCASTWSYRRCAGVSQ